MSNLSEFDRILQLHKYFLVGAPYGESAKFVDLDLRGQDFSGMDLTGASFDGVALDAANFSHAILKGATFSGCSLLDASFINAHTVGMTMRGCAPSDLIVVGSTDISESSPSVSQEVIIEDLLEAHASLIKSCKADLSKVYEITSKLKSNLSIAQKTLDYYKELYEDT